MRPPAARSRLAALALCVWLPAACSDVPLPPPDAVATSGAWPELRPVGALLAEADMVTISDETAAGLLARGRALRARAAVLRTRTVGG